VASIVCDHKSQIGLRDRCDLAGCEQHSTVGGDQPFPWWVVQLKGHEELPVIDLCEVRIDFAQSNEFRLDDVLVSATMIGSGKF
jgi:hypothetical protein